MQNILTEEQEQITFCQYLELKNIKYSAIAHSTWTKSWSQKAKNKRTGLKRGVPDLLILLEKQKMIIFLEMKREKKSLSRVSLEQQDWIDAINRIGGTVEAVICYGATQAISFVEKQLKRV